MTRRRVRHRGYLLGSLLLLAASLHAPTAYSAPGDPPKGSPSGAVYELPFERGREDASPKGGGGTGGGGGTSGASGDASGGQTDASGSLYRSENNFGSSSRVPGLAYAGRAGGDSDGDGSGSGVGGLGTGGPGGPGDGGRLVGGAIAADVTDAGNTSVPASLILLGAIALLAGGIAVLSRRFSAR